MAEIFGVKFNFLTIAGLLVLTSILLVGLWKVVDDIIPQKKQSAVSTQEVLNVMRPRWVYEDSMAIAKQQSVLDSIRYYAKSTRQNDSLLYNFYKTQPKKNEKINRINNISIAELMQQWAVRYENR